MSKTIKLKKGLDIRLAGKAEKILTPEIPATRYAVKPVDFPGLYPKVCVKPGDEVKAGSPLFYGKFFPEFKFTSPVSGKVVDVVRGERRKLLEVVVEVKGDDYIDFGKASPSKTDRSVIKEKLLLSGLWPALRQRPYNIIARPDQTPKAIFISAFDTAPLAPDLDFVVRNLPEANFQEGLDVLSKLTDGKIHLVLNPDYPAAEVLKKAKGVEFNYVTGPHPAGNPGIHIHHIDPVNKGEVVWVVNIQDVFTIGRLFSEGVYKPEKIVALTGSEVLKPKYYRTRSGACIDTITKDNIKGDNVRFISGNVLTGSQIEAKGFLGYYDSSVTVIPEGNYHEFLGWLGLGFKKFSFSRSFLSWLVPGKEFRLDTNYNGGERALVVTGEYEKVLPMDIYPMHLLKAILANDIDLMEKLGIYEVAEEDFALCEFICPSKTEIQTIIRQGLDSMVKEMS